MTNAGVGPGRRARSARNVRNVTIVRVLDDLPEAVTRSATRVWAMLARSLGEDGASGRVALAWRWALTGACPSPVTLTTPAGRPPRRDDLAAEADAPAELGRAADHDGQVEQARLVLKWLAGSTGAWPLREAPDDHGAPIARTRDEADEAYTWAQLARLHHPWQPGSAPAASREAAGWAQGAHEFLAWACGETGEGPLDGPRVIGRPSLPDLALGARDAMIGMGLMRDSGDIVGARRLESAMEAFLWLAGWNTAPPVDRHGHLPSEDCPERDAPCGCGPAGRCLRGSCPACLRVACVHGFGQDDDLAAAADGS